MKKWLGRTVLVLLLLLAVAVFGGAVYETLAARQAARDYPPTGQLLDIGGRRLHLDWRCSRPAWPRLAPRATRGNAHFMY